MGGFFTKLFKGLFGDENYRILILGLDGVGKTTILYQMSIGEVVYTKPTIGSNVEEVKFNNLKFECWDVGGQESIRESWSSYYVDTNAVVLVVDSSDHERIDLIQNELFSMANHQDLKNALFLVFANKQDINGAMNSSQLSKALKLSSIKDQEWHIQSCCALTGEGLKEGWTWLANKLKKKK
ncbi:adp-ribosylation factor c1 [Anaeramoeba ignava]|uniref:Adp-ribosylation factor c1 n=1 Tax=Anaeramoeba ignava TaxID=1746090 RepID=A0A9Q0LEK9_ANAIG|nr:adp-ribosylation factor c1 [Anaeramoeba ignava]